MTDLADIWSRGYNAFNAFGLYGGPELNPYDPEEEIELHEAFSMGWEDAKADESARGKD
jgi:hypothetical protein